MLTINESQSSIVIRLRELSPISDDALLLLFRAVKELRFKKNEFLLEEGQTCKYIYFIESGCVRTFQNKDGQDINLSFHLENSFATDLKSLRMETPSGKCIQALEPTVTWRFEKRTLTDLYSQSEEIMTVGKALLEQLLMEQEEHSNMFKVNNAQERYRYLEKYQPQLLQRVSLSLLCSYLGISRKTLSRIRGM